MTSSLIKQSIKQEFKRFCLNISGKLNLHQILPILFRLITSLKDKGQQLLFLRGNIAPYRTRWLSVPSNTWPLCACWHQPGRNFQMNLYLEVQKPLLTKMINLNWHFKIKIKKIKIIFSPLQLLSCVWGSVNTEVFPCQSPVFWGSGLPFPWCLFSGMHCLWCTQSQQPLEHTFLHIWKQ